MDWLESIYTLDEMTNFSPHVKVLKHGLFLPKASKMHFNATFTHLSAAFKYVSLSSDTARARQLFSTTNLPWQQNDINF